MKLEQERSEWRLSSTQAQSGKSVLPVDQLQAELLNSLLRREGPESALIVPRADQRFPKMSGY